MAQNETWLNHDLLETVRVQYLDGNLFSMDNAGNLIGVNLTRDGVDYSGGGSVSASVIRADGSTVSVVGALSGNVATVVLPQAAYAVPGVASIVVKLTVSGEVTTIAAVVANVYQSSTDSVVDPGTIIPSVQALISAIESAVASIPADYSSLWASLAPTFSTSTNYTAGQYVTYSGALYRFITDHPAGAWNSAHVTATNIGADLNGLKSAIALDYNELTFPVAKGTKCFYGRYLYEAKDNIPEYEEWTQSHWRGVDIGSLISCAYHGIAYSTTLDSTSLPDADSAPVNNIFRINNTTGTDIAHLPSQVGTLITYSYNDTVNQNTNVQVFFDANGVLFTRVKSNGSWTEWTEYDNNDIVRRLEYVSKQSIFTESGSDAQIYTQFAQPAKIKVKIIPIQTIGEDPPSAQNICPIIAPVTNGKVKIKRCNINMFEPSASTSLSGLEGTLNNDGSFSITGQSSSTVLLPVGTITLQKGVYEFSGVSGGSSSTYGMRVKNMTTDENTDFYSGSVFIKVTEQTKFNVLFRKYSSITEQVNYTIYPKVRPAFTSFDTAFEKFTGETTTVTLPGENTTVYGGILEIDDKGQAKFSLTHGYIASYDGETLPGYWISDRDVYESGTSPSSGAEVVYELATPTVYDFNKSGIELINGYNYLWSDSGIIEVTYYGNSVSVMDSYEKPQPYLMDTIQNAIREAGSVYDQPSLVFIWATDSHYNPNYCKNVMVWKHTVDAMRYMFEHTPSRFLLHTGDLVDQYYYIGGATSGEAFGIVSKSIKDMRSIDKNIIILSGNHDGIEANIYNATAWVYGCFGKIIEDYANVADGVNSYAYKDFPDVNVRLIALSCPDSNVTYQNYWGFLHDQIEWLANTALNTPDNWGVILTCHLPIMRRSNGKELANRAILQGVLNAYHNHQAYSAEYDEKGTTHNISVDFTGKSGTKLIICLSGHSHSDVVVASGETLPNGQTNELECPIVASGAVWPVNVGTAGYTTPSRTIGTDSEILFNVVCYKPNSQTIDIIRVGAGDSVSISLA